jgi:hypothetical protein
LVNQDDLVALNHAHQGNHAQQSHKTKGAIKHQQGPCHTRYAQWACQKHQQGAAETLQLQHQQVIAVIMLAVAVALQQLHLNIMVLAVLAVVVVQLTQQV